MRIGWSGASDGKACVSGSDSERVPSGSRLGPRGGAASRSSFRAFAGLRSGAAHALAGAFVLLALGVLAAPQAEAQSATYVAVIDGITPGRGSEGTTFAFRVRLVDPSVGFVGAPPGGLTVNLTVSDTTTAGADYVAPQNEGAKTVTFREGQSEATYRVPTVDDNQDEPDGTIKLALAAGNGYTVSESQPSQTPTVTDNDTPVPNLTVNPVSGNGDKLNVSWSAPTGVSFTGYSVLWKTRSQTYLRGSRTGSASFLASTTSYQITGLTPGTEYDVLVNALTPSFRVVAGSGTSATTHSNRAPAFLAQYYFFELAENDDGSTTPVSLGSVLASDADGTTVSYSITDGNPGNKFAISSTGAITYTGSGENYESFRRNRAGFGTPDMAYVLTVEATDAGGASGAATVQIEVTDVDDPPAAPAAPTVSPTQYTTTSLDVNWERPANGGPPITSYDLRYKRSADTGWTSGPQDVTVPVTFTRMSARITGLTAGTAYQVQVRASNEEGDGPWSNSGTGTTTATPPSVVDGVTGINLTLNRNSIDEGGQAQWITATVSLIGQTRSTATSVTIDGEGITTDLDILTWAIHKTITIPANARRVTTTLGITPYDDSYHEGPETFRIIAAAAIGGYELIDKEVVTIIDNDLGRLIGLTVTPVPGTTDSLRISWNAFPGANDYRFEWKSGNAEYHPSSTTRLLSANTSTTHSGRSPGTTYTYRITALDTTTNPHTELAQAEASGTTALPAITNFTVSPVDGDGTKLRLSWDAVQGANNYLLEWKSGNQEYATTGRRSLVGNVTSATPTGLSPGTTYTYRLTALNTATNPDTKLAQAEASGTTYAPLPTIANFTVSPVSGEPTKLSLRWDSVQGAGKYRLEWKSGDQEYNSVRSSSVTITSATLTGLSSSTTYTVRVTALNTATNPDTELAQAEGSGTTALPTIANFTVSPVMGDGTKLRLSWDTVQGANNYLLQWKSGNQEYVNTGRRSLVGNVTSATPTGLSPGTTYTYRLTALNTATDPDTELAQAEASGTTVAATGTGQAQITVYHDPRPSDASAAAGSRYDSGVALLKAASRSYAVRTVTGTGTVDDLAGVENSVLPRFFLGDPTEEGWGPSEPGVNNGGLKWLRKVLEEQQESSPPPAPTVTVEAGAAVDEGTAASFTVTFSQAAPADGLTLAYTVSEDGAFVAASDEGAKTLAIAGGATSATLSVATADDDGDEADGKVTVTLDAGTGYEVGDPASASVTVRDDDEPVAAPAAFTVYHDPNAGAAAVTRYNTALTLLKAAGRTYAVRTVSGTAKVDDLAGVSGSVMPRFFLGDPEAEGWGPARAKVNNGGLKWLRSALGQTQAASASAGTVSVSVADASAREASGSIAFAVTLSAAAREAVSVDWATRDGTATSGTDYTAASGTLTFATGETRKSVTVTLLDDVHDEGTETFSLVLSNPRPGDAATLADGTATGTISNADPLQKDWLARFGRAVASDAIAAVTVRLEVPRDAGSHFTLGGHRMALDGSGGEPGLPPAPAFGPGTASWLTWSGDPAGDRSRTMTTRELLLGTSFRAVLGQGAGSQFTSWGQGASVSQFSSAGTGLSLSGEAATGAMGMDYERGRLLTGFAMTHSVGEGTAQGAGRVYAMGSSVTTMLPYARLRLSERLSAWGLAGTGSGSLSLELDGGPAERYGTDLSMTLAAMGMRGELVTPAEADGFALALKADAFWVRTESDRASVPGVGNLAGAQAEASRVRAVLDGSRKFALADGGTLTPSATLGLRHDGGDAETGTGVELGAGIGYADPSRGLDMALRVHGLAAHAADGYSEWGVSGSIRLVPGGAGRGLSMSLTPSHGVDPGSKEPLWMLSDASGLAANDDAPLSSRLDAELGYGIALFGGGFTGTPNVGFGLSDTMREYRMGWRLSSARPGDAGGFELSLDAARREAANDPGASEPEHRIGFGLTARW